MKTLKTITVLTLVASFNLAWSQLKFEKAEIYAPLKGSHMSAGYMTVQNESAKPVVLSLKSVEKFKASETHETLMKKGEMMMQKVDSFTIPAHGSLVLQPGGKHMMLFDPTAEIKVGSKLKATFLIDKKKSEKVEFSVIERPTH